MNKCVRVLFVLMFLLSMGPLSVQAQGVQTSIAYLPLLPSANQGGTAEASEPGAGLPIQMQARQWLEALLPNLLKAQAEGQVVRFQPELSGGLVMVEYTAGSDLAGLMGNQAPVFDSAQAALEYSQAGKTETITQLAPPTGNPYVYLGVNSSCFNGGNLGPYNTYKATLKDASGRPVGFAAGHMDSDGWFNACFDGVWGGMVPGFTFTLKVYNSDGSSLLHTYTTGISRIQINSITPATRIVRGIAPANSSLGMWLYHLRLDATCCYVKTLKTTSASSTGAWQFNFSPSAMRGGDEVYLYLSKPGTIFTLTRYQYAPFVECGLGGTWCEIGGGTPGGPVTLYVKHAGSTYSYTGRFSTGGWFEADLLNGYGEPIFLATGDQAWGTGVSTLTIPTLTAAPNFAANTVTGRAPANRWFEVDILRYNPESGWWNGWWRWVKSSAAGTYSANFSIDLDITTAETYILRVYFHDPTTGNVTYYENMVFPITSAGGIGCTGACAVSVP